MPAPTAPRYRFHGTLNGIAIDEAHASYASFVRKWGGTRTPLKINRQKLHRLVTGFYDSKRNYKRSRLLLTLWRVRCDPIA